MTVYASLTRLTLRTLLPWTGQMPIMCCYLTESDRMWPTGEGDVLVAFTPSFSLTTQMKSHCRHP